MNRKNLTAAVLAGLAGAAGIAGTAQAVNMNPDGLGQVLVYPYYTANDGNTTILSVVNTTDNAKAVKVRFLEGFNSREVLDFNLYLSHHDVWVAAIAKSDVSQPIFDYETDTFLIIPDDSCTVPYLYGDTPVTLPDGTKAGLQPFLNLAYTGDFDDGGPDSDGRAAEGHFEMIEMGTIRPGSDTEDDITHQIHKVLDDDGKATGETFWAPGDCEQLVKNWTGHTDFDSSGIWYKEADYDGKAYTDTDRNSGGLFGGAAVINPANGAMWSYNARAIQGFDKSDDGMHFIPGTIHPSLNDGDQRTAYVFFGVPQNSSVELQYAHSVDAVSAVFMHEFTMNEYTTAAIPAEAATEWVVTMPTKSFYADPARLEDTGVEIWFPTEGNPGCGNWSPGDSFPIYKSPAEINLIDGPGPWVLNVGWENCPYESDDMTVAGKARAPFTEVFGAKDCELVTLQTWDRDERTFEEERGGAFPPVVSPAPPVECDPAIQFCENVIFELCNEVNVLRFGERSIFGTPTYDEGSLLLTVMDEFTEGWGAIDFYFDEDHVDYAGLVGLPVAGFAAYQFENDFIEGDDGTVKAFYGGLFDHKGNVRRVRTSYQSME